MLPTASCSPDHRIHLSDVFMLNKRSQPLVTLSEPDKACSTLCSKHLSVGSLFQLLFLGVNITSKNAFQALAWVSKKANPKQNAVCQFCVLVCVAWGGRGIITITFFFFSSFLSFFFFFQDHPGNEHEWKQLKFLDKSLLSILEKKKDRKKKKRQKCSFG